MKPALLFAALAALLAACPIAADNFGDGGSDTGDGGTSAADAGSTVDAGTPATGTASCSISASGPLGGSGPSPYAWSGSDFAGTTASTSDGTTYTVDVVAIDAISGSLGFELANLAVGSNAGYTTNVIEWQAPSGFTPSDTWTCGSGSACIGQVTVTAFDGLSISGAFQVQFFAGSSSTGANSASLSNGSFAVTLPH